VFLPPGKSTYFFTPKSGTWFGVLTKKDGVLTMTKITGANYEKDGAWSFRPEARAFCSSTCCTPAAPVQGSRTGSCLSCAAAVAAG